MKKGLVLLLCCTLLLPCLFLLASCGGDPDATGAPTGACWITFSVDGVDHTYLVANGETPVCPEEFLSWETEEHYYKVTGWDKEIVPVDGNATYVATVGEYGLTLYDIRFNMPGGIVKVPTHEGEVPTPPAGYETDLVKRVDKIGRFDHWTSSVPEFGSELVAPTAANMEGKSTVVYTPFYNYDETRYYTVTFVVGDNEYKVKTAGNTLPVCPVDPTSAETSADKFVGWDQAIGKATKDVTYTAWYGNELFAEILPAKDGAKAILTMTYDDGDLETAKWVNQKNKQYGLAGSCMIITSRSGFKDHIPEWRAVFADGTLEPQCHSTTHSSDTKEGPPSLYQREIVDSKNLLATTFPKNDIICYATPYCFVTEYSYKTDANGNVIYQNGAPVKVKDGGSQKVIQENYFANRNGPSGFQSLDPTPDANEGGWYNPYVQWFYSKTSQTDAIRLKWIDSAVAQGKWLIILAHQIVDEPANEYQLKKTNAETFYKHAAPYVQSGELWAATFGEATKYIRERQGATAYRKMGSGTLSVGLKIDRTTPDGHYMDENIFNYPLTVRVRVPSSWNSVEYELSGKSVNTTCYDADGHRYVNVNVVPGDDGAVVNVLVTRVD